MHFETAQDQLDALRENFSPAVIQVREENGVRLHYLEWSTVQNRLLDVLGAGGFDLEVGRITQSKTRMDLECILTIRYVDGKSQRVTGFGSADILYLKKDSDLPLDERRWVTDSFKSALSDGGKVAASKLGVGLHLYDSGAREELGKQVQEARAAEAEKAEANKEASLVERMTTCMSCQGRIMPGEYRGKTYDDPVAMVKVIRKDLIKRLCLECVAKLKDA